MKKVLFCLFALSMNSHAVINYPKKSPEQLQAWCNQFMGWSSGQSYSYKDYLGNPVTREATFKIIQCKHDGQSPWIITEKQDPDSRKIYKFLIMFSRGSDNVMIPSSSDIQLGDCPQRLGDYLIAYYQEQHIALPPDFDEALRANARDQICPGIREGALAITLRKLTE